MWRVHPEVDGQVRDALVGSGDSVGLVLDLLHDGVEVLELLSLAVEELSILVGRVDELEDEGTAGHDAAAAGKKISERKEENTYYELISLIHYIHFIYHFFAQELH